MTIQIDERRDPGLAARAMAAAFDERYELIGGLEENWQEACLAASLRALAQAPPLWINRGWLHAVADALEAGNDAA